MPCRYLKKSCCKNHSCKTWFHNQRKSAFVKLINERFFQSSEITLRDIFEQISGFGLLGPCFVRNAFRRLNQAHISLLDASHPKTWCFEDDSWACLLSGAQAARCSPSKGLTEPGPGPLPVKGFSSVTQRGSRSTVSPEMEAPLLKNH